MNMTLTRTDFLSVGIFGQMTSEDGKINLYTLEHAYPDMNNEYVAKIPEGSYQCVLGQHQLKGMAQPFHTYEVTNVPGHTNILIHPGNYNADSEGCILVGLAKGNNAILNSREAFQAFMVLQNGEPEFTLTINQETINEQSS
jgi:hypothetical protein